MSAAVLKLLGGDLASAVMQAYRAGKRAALDRELVTSCTYVRSDLRKAWAHGHARGDTIRARLDSRSRVLMKAANR